jgi:hypothetical protein
MRRNFLSGSCGVLINRVLSDFPGFVAWPSTFMEDRILRRGEERTDFRNLPSNGTDKRIGDLREDNDSVPITLTVNRCAVCLHYWQASHARLISLRERDKCDRRVYIAFDLRRNSWFTAQNLRESPVRPRNRYWKWFANGSNVDHPSLKMAFLLFTL